MREPLYSPQCKRPGNFSGAEDNIRVAQDRITRGFFSVGIYHTKHEVNIGTLWRSAVAFGAGWIFTVGNRYDHQSSDTLKAPRHIPLYHYETFQDFNDHRPHDCQLVAIEQSPSATDIFEFKHPERAIYLLGAEDYGLPELILKGCQALVQIPTPVRLNVAVAGSIVLFDRVSKSGGRR